MSSDPRSSTSSEGQPTADGLSPATVTAPGIGLQSSPDAVAAASRGASAAGPTAAGSPAADAAPGDPFAELPFGDRPEIQLGIAFAGTFLLAKVLKSLAS